MIKKVYGSLNKDKKILYIINHKAGNTSIRNALKNYGYPNNFGTHTHFINPEELNYIFTFVRNPYERLLSRYGHLRRRIIHLENGAKIGNRPHDTNLLDFFNGSPIKIENFTFKDFVKFTQKVFDCHWEPQVDKFKSQVITLDNIDFIGRFENLQEDFNVVCDKIGIPRQQLPHDNKTEHKHYAEYYDKETRQIVAEKYAEDIKYFGYKFDS